MHAHQQMLSRAGQMSYMVTNGQQPLQMGLVKHPYDTRLHATVPCQQTDLV